MSVDAASLKDFIKSLSLLETIPLNNSLFLKCQNNCIEIISVCKRAFPEECGQIDLILQMTNAKIISAKQGIQIIKRILIYMAGQWDDKIKPQKLFISHSTDDKEIVINHSYIFGQVLKSSQMPVKPYFMGVPGSFHIRHSSRIFSHLGVS